MNGMIMIPGRGGRMTFIPTSHGIGGGSMSGTAAAIFLGVVIVAIGLVAYLTLKD